jgi:hypothetical protein
MLASITDRYGSEQTQKLFAQVRAALRSSDTKLIRAQSVMDDLCPPDAYTNEVLAKIAWVENVPRPLPTFPVIWIEARESHEVPVGIYVRRYTYHECLKNVGEQIADKYKTKPRYAPGDPKWVIICRCFIEYKLSGSAMFIGGAVYWLNEEDRIISYAITIVSDDDDFKYEEAVTREVNLYAAFVVHIFARLNCHNVRLGPISNGLQKSPKRHRHPKAVAETVWHEIKVTSVPNIAGRSAKEVPSGESVDIRFHWVRGHYADYSKGSGLFGNPKLKAVFWIPEHTRGEKEAGEVISSYVV